MIKSDRWIIEQCEKNQLLTPFVRDSVKKTESGERHVSHGPSSYGYDIRLDTKFKIFSNTNQGTGIIDPLDFDEKNYDEHEGDFVIIPPGGFVLGVSKERFKMPRNVTGFVMNKSTYARCSVVCITTVIEAGWEGYLVLEYANNSPLPAKLYANQGAAQIVFFEADEQCLVSYADRDGKYQNQEGVQEAIC
jgi:dCTP deaminase